MAKLSKNCYTTSKGERKLNCFVLNIPKEVVFQTKLIDKEVVVYAKEGKIIIDKK